MKSKILITGGNGQLATCIRAIDSTYDQYEFIYTDYEDLDITDFQHLRTFFKENSVQWCVNCAAYTAVDKAESEEELASKINVLGAENLAKICNEFKTKLIHISTDFVFDGYQSIPYTENDQPKPLGVYGQTKLDGELKVQEHLHSHFILRTSWLYSEYGHNFLKTMLRLSSSHHEIKVVADQVGTPTYAGDLANTILKFITSDSSAYGMYHYSNEGVASWYDFAKMIFEFSKLQNKVSPIPSTEYPTPAARPNYSVLDNNKIKKTLSLEIPYWQDSLKLAIKQLQ